MLTIEVTIPEGLLQDFDELPEVRARGRSAVLWEVVAAYLREKRSEEIAREYREGYTKYPQTDEDLEWASIQAWSED